MNSVQKYVSFTQLSIVKLDHVFVRKFQIKLCQGRESFKTGGNNWSNAVFECQFCNLTQLECLNSTMSQFLILRLVMRFDTML